MWLYEKKLEYPVKIKNPNPALAKVIISQLGGPDGEIGAATRYLQQRYSMPYGQVKGMLTDIGTEELAHVEMISAILYQLTQNLSMADIKKSGFDTYFVDHTTGAFPQFASGTPFTTAILQVTGDALADLYEDLAAEQKARLSYDNILRLIDDPDVRDPIKFLREREVVHFQRFGETVPSRWNGRSGAVNEGISQIKITRGYTFTQACPLVLDKAKSLPAFKQL
ncbi:manganese catalase family protein [Anaerotruncus rubiinfantis]|uniref:manganese catalase family protein n=1 Tax=Anaerotruncus rubiinfantis TaxID=1720200 RepID=UPI0034A4F720